MRKIKLKIQNYQDRENIVIALANAGYPVITKRIRPRNTYGPDDKYYVIFEIDGKETA
jgi:hypothetical protein